MSFSYSIIPFPTFVNVSNCGQAKNPLIEICQLPNDRYLDNSRENYSEITSGMLIHVI